LHVEGATGYLDTNYRGKAEKALERLEDLDFIFLHVEAPDEAAHNGNPRDKIRAIENFDRKVVGTVLDGMRHFENYRVMVISDHFTPIPIKTHTAEPTPFAWATGPELASPSSGSPFTEKNALERGLHYEKGHELIQDFLVKN
ncbi:MAG: phosphoglycerate mutase, partial [Deltaproteobacteria bacterium]|nr:phosphoglycerate mutase [Deltaproteobacteria bacterium]